MIYNELQQNCGMNFYIFNENKQTNLSRYYHSMAEGLSRSVSLFKFQQIKYNKMISIFYCFVNFSLTI
jgi:hypothetical protein